MEERSTNVRFAGFGGQGIVKVGEIFGAAAVLDGKQALQNQAYGSSARGGLCTADVVVGEGEIYEVEPEWFDVLIVLSQDSCNAFVDQLRPKGTLIFEQDMVRLPDQFRPARSAPKGREEPEFRLARSAPKGREEPEFRPARSAPNGREGPEFPRRAYGVPATQIAANDLGRRIVTNMVVLGFCGVITGLIERQALEQTIQQSVPRGTEELNLRAFAEGWRRGEAL